MVLFRAHTRAHCHTVATATQLHVWPNVEWQLFRCLHVHSLSDYHEGLVTTLTSIVLEKAPVDMQLRRTCNMLTNALFFFQISQK